MGNLLYGKDIAQEIHKFVRSQINEIQSQTGVVPTLAILWVGKKDRLRIAEYNLHAKLAFDLGVNVREIMLEDATEDKVSEKILQCNEDDSIHGILVLLPLPDHIDQDKVIALISKDKELEGLQTQKSMDNLFEGKQISVVSAILMMLQSIDFDIFARKNVFIIDEKMFKENAVIKRVLHLAKELKFPFEIVTAQMDNVKEITNKADLLLVSVETAELIDKSYVKEGAVVIDFNPIQVGEKFSEKKGEVVPIIKSGLNVDSVNQKASYVSPSLGGIGPISLANLMKNFLYNYKAAISKLEVKK